MYIRSLFYSDKHFNRGDEITFLDITLMIISWLQNSKLNKSTHYVFFEIGRHFIGILIFTYFA